MFKIKVKRLDASKQQAALPLCISPDMSGSNMEDAHKKPTKPKVRRDLVVPADVKARKVWYDCHLCHAMSLGNQKRQESS